jgi:hypothetical protein
MGLVYLSTCRRFMIVRENKNACMLAYTNAQKVYVRVRDLHGVQAAKSEAQRVQDLEG